MSWQDPPELRLVKLLKVQGDGLLRVHRPEGLAALAAPWSQARGYAEVLLEIKMAGDHLDEPPVERAVLRRQAMRVQQVEGKKPPWPRQEPLWLAAPHVPEWLGAERKLVRVGRGCYSVRPSWAPFLWIAANDLPLRDELVPFLVARSGEALDEFARWVAPRRPVEWVLNMIEYTAMSTTVSDELLRKFGPVEDPVIEARRQKILRALLETSPQVRQELIEQGIEQGIERGIEKGIEKGIKKGIKKGRLVEARWALREVLQRRQLPLTPAHEARIDQCTDFATLRRWLMQAVTAATAAEALQ